MLLNIIYLLMGLMVGFLIKYELDMISRKKRIIKRAECLKAINTDKHNETLKYVRELNDKLLIIQKKKEAK